MDSLGMQNMILEWNILQMEEKLQNMLLQDNAGARHITNSAPMHNISSPEPINTYPNVLNTPHLTSRDSNSFNSPFFKTHYESRKQSAARVMTSLLPSGTNSVGRLQNNWTSTMHDRHASDLQSNSMKLSSNSFARTLPMKKDQNSYPTISSHQKDFHGKVYQESLVAKRVKATKSNKKTAFHAKATLQKYDYSKVVVNLDEIGLGPQRCRPDPCTRLVLKFRRLYVYLTTFSKERKLVESIIFNRVTQPGNVYSLPMNESASRYFEYALENLMTEMRALEPLTTNIQRAYDESNLILPYTEGVNKMHICINDMLALFSNSCQSGKSGNMDISKVDTVLSRLIENLRFLGTFFILTAQTLLAKQTSALQGRRNMGRGN